MWSSVWNRWCTARRFQKNGPCLLGCLNRCDSIEHYMGCKVVRQVGWKVLRLQPDNDYEERKRLWLGVTSWTNTREATCWYLLVYAVYMTTNGRRNSKEKGGEEEELKQHLRNAVEGHPKSAEVARGRWVI